MRSALLTIEDIAQRMQISKRTVYNLINRSEFPPVIKFGRAARFAESDIDDYIEARRRGMTYQKYLTLKKQGKCK